MPTSDWGIVVGGGLNGLGVVRALGSGGVRVAVVDANPDAPAMHSRFTRVKARPEGGDLIGAIRDVASRVGGKPALILTTEAAVKAVSDGRAQLLDHVRLAMSPPALMDQLMSKERFQALAEEWGFPVPRSVILERPSDSALAADLTYPCVLKPAVKNEVWERTNQKAYRFADYAELRRFCDGLAEGAPALIVQEWIEGRDSDVYFTFVYRDEQRRTVARFTGRKLRQWPPLVGGTALCTGVDAETDAQLGALTTAFFDRADFVGMGSVEYKRDSRSGRFVMVEPTVGRTNYQEEIATLNGVNLPLAAYCSLCDLPVPAPNPPRRRYAWRDAEGDSRSRARQRGALMPPELEGAIVKDALFRLDDIGPWSHRFSARLAARLGRFRKLLPIGQRV